jgi:hypothetical protein
MLWSTVRVLFNEKISLPRALEPYSLMQKTSQASSQTRQHTAPVAPIVMPPTGTQRAAARSGLQAPQWVSAAPCLADSAAAGKTHFERPKLVFPPPKYSQRLTQARQKPHVSVPAACTAVVCEPKAVAPVGYLPQSTWELSSSSSDGSSDEESSYEEDRQRRAGRSLLQLSCSHDPEDKKLYSKIRQAYKSKKDKASCHTKRVNPNL